MLQQNRMTPTPVNPISNSMPSLGLLSDSSLTQLVNGAFRNYQSTLALSRSPLANSTLVVPTLVLDDVSPTAEERGRGLRLILRWAVEQIAPHAPTYPLGTFRPFDDPTWSDPLWWRYNILRHRYVEPLHPDDFIGGRYTETLMALTGITSNDAFFDERNRAIQEVTERLRQQLIDGAGNQNLQQMALTEAMRRLDGRADAAQLLGIAATFDDIFPRSLLLTMATEEQIRHAEPVLDYLIANRLLLAGDEQQNLWLSPTFRHYIYQRQATRELSHRHRSAARFYDNLDEPLTTAKHWQHAELHDRAATVLFKAAEELVNELQIVDLIRVLQNFHERNLSIDRWREVQILLSDLYYKVGQPEDALAACRRALKSAEGDIDQARIYRRMGKLYVTRNQLHALGYYQQAVERFASDNPEVADLLKDRAWLHILRRNWEDAERDLLQAQSIASVDDTELHADIHDALASLYRRQKQFDSALKQAQQAQAIREQLGNLPRIASSFNNIGLIYRQLGEYGNAIGAYEEALVTYRALGNREATAGVLMNIGNAHFLLKRLGDAIDYYHQTLTICVELQQPHVEATVHYNLAEAYAAMQRQPAARDHWQRGYDLSQRSGFADEVQAFEQLQAETPLLQVDHPQPLITLSSAPTLGPTFALARPALPPDEQAVLALAETYGRITAKLLTEQLDISRATATRRLSALVEAGHLTQQGKGRGVYYTAASQLADPVDEDKVQAPAAATTSVTLLPPTGEAMQKLEKRLAAEQSLLHARFGVTAIMPMTPPTTSPTTHPMISSTPLAPMPRLTVHFDQMPTLATFFELRIYLQERLGFDIDLWPAQQ